jgi:hypothetical protein
MPEAHLFILLLDLNYVEAGLKKRWRFNVINGIIKANNENKLRMPILSKTNKLLNIRAVVSVISKLCWYIFIGTRLTEARIILNSVEFQF